MNNNRVHSFLATQKFPTLDSVHQHVFERLLGQRVSNTRDLQVAEEKLLIAKRDSRPILFVLNRSSFGIGTALNKSIGRGPPRNLLPHYMVISLKPKDLPALSRLTKQPPYEVSGVSATTYVVCRSNGEQIGAAVEQNSRDFPKLLAEGLVDNAIRNPPETKKLKMLIRLVDRYDDEGFGDELRQLYQEQISAAKVPTLSDEEVLARALLLE